jgi:type II secretory pathway pseudopilin PulG
MVTQMRASMRGFTYLGLLFAIVLLGVVLAATGIVWHTQNRREMEQELLFAGEQYMKAIAGYRAVLVNGQGMLPKSLDELLEDKRFPMPVRHLRRHYRDPVANSPEWGLIRSGEGIAGVFSPSREMPLKTANFGTCCAGFGGARSYADWKFTVDASAPPVQQAGAAPAAPTTTVPPPANAAQGPLPRRP